MHLNVTNQNLSNLVDCTRHIYLLGSLAKVRAGSPANGVLLNHLTAGNRNVGRAISLNQQMCELSWRWLSRRDPAQALAFFDFIFYTYFHFLIFCFRFYDLMTADMMEWEEECPEGNGSHKHEFRNRLLHLDRQSRPGGSVAAFNASAVRTFSVCAQAKAIMKGIDSKLRPHLSSDMIAGTGRMLNHPPFFTTADGHAQATSFYKSICPDVFPSDAVDRLINRIQSSMRGETTHVVGNHLD